jgi:two-component system sensor histidine kinase KdpD
VAAPEDAQADVAIDADIHLALLGRTLTTGDRRVRQAVAGRALLALRAQRMAAQALDAQRGADATKLRSALLSVVRHDHDLHTEAATVGEVASQLFDRRCSTAARGRSWRIGARCT